MPKLDEGSSAQLLQNRTVETPETENDKYETTLAEEQLFGPPFAYYKKRKAGISFKLFFAGLLVVFIAALDFLLATNIIIWVRTLDTSDKKEIFQHSAVVCISLLVMWINYKFLLWYIQKFQIKQKIRENKLYQKLATEVIQLENIITRNFEDEPEDKAD